MSTLAPSSPATPSRERLRQEIERRAPLAAGKSHSREKAALAILLYEANRLAAHLSWGFKSLREFAREAGIRENTFAKYKGAGKALHEHEPDSYAATLSAILDGRTLPRLSAVSKLARMASLGKQLASADVRVGIRLLAEPRAKLKTFSGLIDAQVYEGADEGGRRVLSEFDALLAHMERAKERLTGVARDGIGDIRLSALQKRARRLEEHAAALTEVAGYFLD